MSAKPPETGNDAGCWPGTGVRRSTNNGFTLGYSATPHGYVAGAAAAGPKPRKSSRAPAPFAVPGGTIAGMGRDPLVNALFNARRDK